MCSLINRFNLFILPILCILPGCWASPANPTSPSKHTPSPSPDQLCSEIPFLTEYSEAVEIAKQWNKPILLVFTASWCPFSQQMLQHTFRDPEVVRLSKQFVCVQIDIEKTPQLVNSFRVRNLPTVQILSPAATSLVARQGYLSEKELAVYLQQTLHAIAARQTPLSQVR